MKKTVILSTNDSPDYVNYLPYVQKAWNKLGWHTLTFYLGDRYPITDDMNRVIAVPAVSGYRDATVVQTYRLLGGHFVDGLVMTGDVDMIPLCKYWKPDPEKITVYGIDLTGDEQIPMCYVAMDAKRWQEIFPEKEIEEFLEKYPNARSDEFQKYWFIDQNALTERIMPLDFVRVDRGLSGNLAKGRIDRADWENSIYAVGQKIDAHMIRPFSTMQAERIMKMIMA